MLLCLLSFVINLLVGLLYPIYSSLKLISKESKEVSEPEVQRWVSYWILYSIVSRMFCCECMDYEYVGTFLAILKLSVVAFLALPYTNGSMMVYERLFKNVEATKENIRKLVKGAMDKVCAGCCGGKCSEPKIREN